jgi:omega-amidase
MKAALVSLNQAWEDKALNKVKCLSNVQQAAANDCDLIVFPEMTLSGFTMNVSYIAEAFNSSETIDFFSDLALKYHLNIVFGMVIKNDPLPLNCALIVSSEGNVLTKYAKIHPFSYANENKYFSNGNALSHCQINNTNIGISICYDLRFPELYQALSKQVEIIVVIANWPTGRIDHWDVLLRARAIENQTFIMGCNRIGTDGNNIEYIKSSKIFNPYGNELKSVLSNTEIDYYEMDLSQVSYFRTKFPFKQDRKADLYKSIL